MMVNSLWGFIWAGICTGLEDLAKAHLPRCEREWDIEGRAVWVVARTDRALSEADRPMVFFQPHKAHSLVHELQRQGIPADLWQERIR